MLLLVSLSRNHASGGERRGGERKEGVGRGGERRGGAFLTDFVFPDGEPSFSMASTTSMPSVTLPNTTCFPSSHGQSTVHKKNWEGGGGGYSCYA